MISGTMRRPKTNAYFSREQWEGIGEMLLAGASISEVYRTLVSLESMPYKTLRSFVNSVAWARYCGYLESSNG